jgi:hypothetical protein
MLPTPCGGRLLATSRRVVTASLAVMLSVPKREYYLRNLYVDEWYSKISLIGPEDHSRNAVLMSVDTLRCSHLASGTVLAG